MLEIYNQIRQVSACVFARPSVVETMTTVLNRCSPNSENMLLTFMTWAFSTIPIASRKYSP